MEQSPARRGPVGLSGGGLHQRESGERWTRGSRRLNRRENRRGLVLPGLIRIAHSAGKVRVEARGRKPENQPHSERQFGSKPSNSPPPP